MMTPGCSQTNELGVRWLLVAEVNCQLWSSIIALVLYRIRAGCNLQCINHRRATTKKRSCKNSQRHKLLCAPAAVIKTTRIFVVNKVSRWGQLGSSAIISMCHVMRQCSYFGPFLRKGQIFNIFGLFISFAVQKTPKKTLLVQQNDSPKW